MGPWFVIVPGIIALRAPDMGTLAAGFFENPLSVWFAGALLLFGGLLIIAFHQYWSSAAAVMISLLGWFLAIRGVVLLAAPGLIEHAAAASAHATTLVRLGFGILIVIGLYLTYVGWIARPPAPDAQLEL
jgi:hypothetical protein